MSFVVLRHLKKMTGRKISVTGTTVLIVPASMNMVIIAAGTIYLISMMIINLNLQVKKKIWSMAQTD